MVDENMELRRLNQLANTAGYGLAEGVQLYDLIDFETGLRVQTGLDLDEIEAFLEEDVSI